jgi:4-aminobutyrate aminotransferase / (S)-3-amino-2-methylpropionate transaminase / 5-aminovalerate transaminase
VGITRVRFPLPGPKGKKLLEKWHKFEADVVGYQAPVVWESGKGCVVTDVDGNRYIDWTSGVLVTNIGHGHPRLAEAMRKAAGGLLNNYECANVPRIEAAEALIRALPPHLDRCFFLTTGSEATEGAARLMKRRAGKFEILSFEGGFHGRTVQAASMGGMPGPKRGYGPPVPGSIRAAYPNPYRDPSGWCKDGPELRKYFEYLDNLIMANSTGSLAGLIVEPYQGAAGFIFPPRGWLKRLERWARDRGLLFTLDEVQASYGRTGTMWALEHEGLKPDLLCIGKAIGCGVPVSALAGTADIFSCLKKGEMSSTLGGNPFSSAAVPVILDIYKNERLVENSRKMGEYMLRKLKAVEKKAKHLGNVRGMGLVMGMEFVRDKKSKEPAPELIKVVMDRCAENGLLVGSVGMYGNVIRVAPPLVIIKEEVDESVGIMEKVCMGL